MDPRPLETHVDWRHDDVADESAWTVELTDTDARELDNALAIAKAHSGNLLDIGLAQFPLDGLGRKLETISRDLIDGPRGFVRIRTLDHTKYSDDDLTTLYWGIGIHLGDPWPQNHYGHVMGDVTDQGKRLLQGASGYDATIVSGEVIYRHGEATGALPGRLVRGPQAAPVA